MRSEPRIVIKHAAVAFAVIVGIGGAAGGFLPGMGGRREYEAQKDSAEAKYGKKVVNLYADITGGGSVGTLTSDMENAYWAARKATQRRMLYPVETNNRPNLSGQVIEFADGTFDVMAALDAQNSIGERKAVIYDAIMLKKGETWDLKRLIANGHQLFPDEETFPDINGPSQGPGDPEVR